MQRVETQLGMIRDLLGSERQKLRADGILVRGAPINQAQQVGRDAQRHGRVTDTLGHVVVE
jgi:hypothetical protein